MLMRSHVLQPGSMYGLRHPWTGSPHNVSLARTTEPIVLSTYLRRISANTLLWNSLSTMGFPAVSSLFPNVCRLSVLCNFIARSSFLMSVYLAWLSSDVFYVHFFIARSQRRTGHAQHSAETILASASNNYCATMFQSLAYPLIHTSGKSNDLARRCRIINPSALIYK